MKLPKKLNALVVQDLEGRLKGVQDCLVVGYDGMGASQAFELRGRLRQAGCRMRVVKNSLARVAFEKTHLSGLSGHLKGTSAVLYGEGEAILAIAQVVTEWNKDKARKPVIVKAGIMGRSPIAASDVTRLAAIPSRHVLLTRVAREVQGPITSLVCALAGTQRKLVYAVKAVAEKKGKEAAA